MFNEPDLVKVFGTGNTMSSDSETKTPFLIGVGGGTASGKV